VSQLEVRVDGLVLDCDNLCLTKKGGSKAKLAIGKKIEIQLKTLSEVALRIEEEGILACGSAA
jgi:hypothetical protein